MRRRFTPTGVGTIGEDTLTRIIHSVHPHGRGDNVGTGVSIDVEDGSPPRAWGQLLDDAALGWEIRFTPTGVGTIARAASTPVRCPVHPHGRGDNAVAQPLSQHPIGSPPRAWGQCMQPRQHRRPSRFTPTGVGTILITTWLRCGETVHPHGRGDNRSSNKRHMITPGSPPRAWGQ